MAAYSVVLWKDGLRIAIALDWTVVVVFQLGRRPAGRIPVR